jgi:hypothetical protein
MAVAITSSAWNTPPWVIWLAWSIVTRVMLLVIVFSSSEKHGQRPLRIKRELPLTLTKILPPLVGSGKQTIKLIRFTLLASEKKTMLQTLLNVNLFNVLSQLLNFANYSYIIAYTLIFVKGVTIKRIVTGVKYAIFLSK